VFIFENVQKIKMYDIIYVLVFKCLDLICSMFLKMFSFKNVLDLKIIHILKT
jgi:hypothetical protein